MVLDYEYALMAGNAYGRARNPNNTVPVPAYMARAYRHLVTGEIVIAYAGTTFENPPLDRLYAAHEAGRER